MNDPSADALEALRFGMAIVGSLVLAVVGLYLGLTEGGTEMGSVGWAFFVLGSIFLIGNILLRSRGTRPQKRGQR
ncbi:hypothetical protein [Pseudonocardia sp. H11422]|uniref:hypothetical protein n=1 Tax=Pseudonocardia sp. H11422 TaxID=2835866 RepID=UPI001BDC9331|nr:hypothetical protein [Pseudonocardia sp. H11422]